MGDQIEVVCIESIDVFVESESYNAYIIEEWEVMGVLDDLGEEWIYDYDVYESHFRENEEDE